MPGETKVMFWTAGQTYAETPEFVESIPITQTRDYVSRSVLRNADLYHARFTPRPKWPTPPCLRLQATVPVLGAQSDQGR